ncbi:putative hemolysin [Enhygromyxa salina]|uniref:Putative hemolysin n=1 Tax=Enhygromyxa salina TaxID=215803 RepID=A0A0C1ZD98_9BACT|nr:putative hemolysin [Enhygromyxa salina]
MSACLSCLACTDLDSDSDSDGEPAQLRGLEDGLELRWTFEDHVGTQITDLSGNGRHGTLQGGALVSSPQGQAVSLDGVDDYVSVAHLGLRAPALYGGVNGDFTISARVRVADVAKLNTLCFGCGPFSSMYIGTVSPGSTVLSAVSNQAGGSLWPTSSAALADDEWREVTMVVEGGVAARYYLDCEVDTDLQDPNIGLKDYNFSAVGLGANPDRWFGGEIDELRIWSRALSEPELGELCPQPLEQGLELRWTFEDRVDNQVTDMSGNARHGTLHGGSFVSSPTGDAVALDGVDDYLSLAHLGLRSPSLYGGVDGDFTISARVQVADVNKLNSLCFGCGPFSSMYIGTGVYGPKVLSALSNQAGGSLWPLSSSALTNDTWREVTMVVEGGVAARYYLDCEFDSELQNPNIGLKDYNFSAVGLGPNVNSWFGGEIDELRVWNRALPEQELQLLCGDVVSECGEWQSLKTRALGLDKVWTDGTDIIAIGGGDIVKFADGEWLDIEATTSDRWLRDAYDVWGPTTADHWLLGYAPSSGAGLYRYNGSELEDVVSFPQQPNDFGAMIPHDISGAAPNDLWAIAMAECNTFACQDPDCACNEAPSVLLRYDGVDWQQVESPGLVTRIWSDGASTWAVGGRDPNSSPWLTPIGGLVASFDGDDWTVWFDDEFPTLHAVWGVDGDDVWVGGEQGTLRHFELGVWSTHDLPTTATIERIEGRASDEVWALDDEGELWAWDGVGWTHGLTIEGARDFAVYGEGLVVVGEDHGHAVNFIDVDAMSVESLYWRNGDFYPQTMVVDDMDNAVAGTVSHQYSSVPKPEAPPNGTWRWDGSSWSPTYVEFPTSFDQIVGAVDQGFGTRTLTEYEVEPDFHATYEIVDGEILELDPPEPGVRVFDSKLFLIDGQEQLWISTEKGEYFPNATYGLFARVDGVWVDRLPPGLTKLAFKLTQGGERVFANFNVASNANSTWMFEDGQWTDISNPLENSRAFSLAATGPNELWSTQANNTDNPEQLYFWDGVEWHVAKDLWPALGGHDDWWTLDAAGPDDLWMGSSRFSEPESVAHWDGLDWTILPTPALLHGWSEGPQALLIEAASDGVFIHDGIRLWQYENCDP